MLRIHAIEQRYGAKLALSAAERQGSSDMPRSIMGSIKSRLLQNDPLIAVCYLISFLSFFLAGATALNIDKQAPILIMYVDGVVGIISLAMAIRLQRSSTMLPRRLYAGLITLACLLVLSAERQDPSSTVIISTVPVLIFILAE
jgi:hypothetical protein